MRGRKVQIICPLYIQVLGTELERDLLNCFILTQCRLFSIQMVHLNLQWCKPLGLKSWWPRCSLWSFLQPIGIEVQEAVLFLLSKSVFTEWISSFVDWVVGQWTCWTDLSGVSCHSIWSPAAHAEWRAATCLYRQKSLCAWHTDGDETWGSSLTTQFLDPSSEELRQTWVWAVACGQLDKVSENHKGRWAEGAKTNSEYLKDMKETLGQKQKWSSEFKCH